MEFDEVCANDSKVYSTECHMRARACKLKVPLGVVKKGPCGTCYSTVNKLIAEII